MIRNAFPIPNSATLIFSLPIPVTAPYEKLPQVIQISRSVLAQEGQRKVCDMASVTMKDKMSDTCQAEKPLP